MLADEPTAHLDYIEVEGILRLLRDLAEPGRTVVVATHDERLLPLADRVVELSARVAPDVGDPERRTLAVGEILFSQGDPGSHVFVVETGEVELVRLRTDGTEERVASAGPGAYYVELAPLFGLPRSATARAIAASVVTGLSVSDFRQRTRRTMAEIIGRADGSGRDGSPPTGGRRGRAGRP